MTRSLLLLVLLLSLVSIATLAQTEEPMHYAITQPANVSLTLDGTLTLPADMSKPVPVVLLIAGSGPTDRDGNSGYGIKLGMYKMLADSLNRLGIAIARYDKRYSGTNLLLASAKVPIQQHQFPYFVSDAVGFIRQLQTDKRFSKVIVAGHSEGSLVGMMATEQTKADKFISIAGAGQNIAEIMKTQIRAGAPDTLSALADVVLDSLNAGRTVQRMDSHLMSLFSLKNQPGMISWMKFDPAIELKKLNVPVLIINGKHDIQVAVSEAERLKAARPNAELMLFDDMNHIMKNAPADRAENMQTYSDPTLPLTPGLATAIAEFAKK